MSPKATILVVDDEPDVREVLQEYFVAHGYAVIGAESANAAKAMTAQHPIDLALVDIHMPGEDGLRAGPGGRGPPAGHDRPGVYAQPGATHRRVETGESEARHDGERAVVGMKIFEGQRDQERGTPAAHHLAQRAHRTLRARYRRTPAYR